MRSLLAFLCLSLPAAGEPRNDSHGDPLPESALVRFGTVRDRVGSEECRRSFDLSPDGKWLAVEDQNNITLWDVDTGRPTTLVPWRYWQGYRPLFDLRFSPDGKQIARVAGRLIQVIEVKSGKVLFEQDMKDEEQLRAVAFIPGTTRISVTGQRQQEAFVFDLATGQRISKRKLGAEKLLYPVGRDYFGTGEQAWVFWDGETGQIRAQFPRSAEAEYERWCFTPDRRRVCFLSDGRLRVFDTETGKLLDQPELSRGGGSDGGFVRREVIMSADGSIVYVRHSDKQTDRWDLTARKWLDPLPAMTPGRLVPLPDRKRLLLIGHDGVLQRFDIATGRELSGPDGFRWGVFASPSPDGSRVAVASGAAAREPRLDLFDITGRPCWSLRPGRDYWGIPHWTPDGRKVAFAGFDAVSLRDVANAKLLLTLRPQWDLGLTRKAFFPPDKHQLLAPYRQDGIHVDIFDLKTGERTGFVDTDAPAVDLSPDGRTLLCVPEEGGIRLIDRTRLQATAPCPNPPDRDRWAVPPHPRYVPDGSYILSWEKEQARAPTWAPTTFAVLRDPETLTVKRQFEAEEADVIAFSPDCQWMAIGKSHGRWVLYDIALGDKIGVWEGHRDAITSINFVGPGRVLTGSTDLTALLWDLKPKEKPKKPLWEAITGNNADEAYRAVWALAADPKAPDLLRSKITVKAGPPTDKVKQWIADLSANQFTAREAATKALQDLGRLVEPDLRAR